MKNIIITSKTFEHINSNDDAVLLLGSIRNLLAGKPPLDKDHYNVLKVAPGVEDLEPIPWVKDFDHGTKQHNELKRFLLVQSGRFPHFTELESGYDCYTWTHYEDIDNHDFRTLASACYMILNNSENSGKRKFLELIEYIHFTCRVLMPNY